MMKHRLNDHPARVKPCRDGKNCTRQTCWYKHEIDTHTIGRSGKDTANEWVSDELDNENEDFQQAQQPKKPPAQTKNKISTPTMNPSQTINPAPKTA